MRLKDHWENVYSTKPANAVSWFQEHASHSLDFIRSASLGLSGAIIDVGGGASTLVDDLLSYGYRDITVLDLSGAALTAAKRRIGPDAERVQWIEADITKASLPVHRFDLWHDRAVFHFLTAAEDREAYVNAVLRSVKPGGHIIMATFAEDGPDQCSGLPVMRYRAAELHSQFGSSFVLVRHEKESHQTPFGTVQQFVYCYCIKNSE